MEGGVVQSYSCLHLQGANASLKHPEGRDDYGVAARALTFAGMGCFKHKAVDLVELPVMLWLTGIT